MLGIRRNLAYGFSITSREPDEWIAGNSSYRTMSDRLWKMREALCASPRYAVKTDGCVGKFLGFGQTAWSRKSCYLAQDAQRYSSLPTLSLPIGRVSTPMHEKLQFQYYQGLRGRGSSKSCLKPTCPLIAPVGRNFAALLFAGLVWLTAKLRIPGRMLSGQRQTDFGHKASHLAVLRSGYTAVWDFPDLEGAVTGDALGGAPIRSARTQSRRFDAGLLRNLSLVRRKTLQVFIGVSALGLLFGYPCKADVWEFDRQGNVLNSPREELAYNFPYDTSIAISRPQGAPVKSSRSAATSPNRAIYRPIVDFR